MTPDYDLDGMRLLVGDVRARLRDLPDESVHAAVTSPPYWALRKYDVEPVVWDEDDDPDFDPCDHDWGDESIVRHATQMNEDFNERWGQGSGQRKQEEGRPQEYSQGRFCVRCGAWLGHYGLEPTPDLYVLHTVEIFRELRRVLRADGTLWLNLGDCYTSGDRKWRHPGSTAQRNGSPMTGLEESGSRPGTPAGLKPKDLVQIPARVALALQADGWWLRQDIIWAKPNSMPESVDDRPSTAHEHVYLLAKSERYFYDVEGAKVPSAPPNGGRQKAALRGESDRVGTGKAQSSDHRDLEVGRGGVWQERHGYQPAERRLRSVWTIPTAQYPHAHFATFPPDLVEPCIRLATSERGVCAACGAPWARIVEAGEPELAANTWSANGANQYEMREGGVVDRSPEDHGSTLKHIRRSVTLGWEPTCTCAEGIVPAVVLDPFAGSGTTLAVARRLGREGLGIELSVEYAAVAVEHRLTRWWRDPPRPAREDEDQLSLEETVRT